MPWPELLDTITAAPTSRLFSGEPNDAQELLDAIRSEQPPVVWYPGSGADFTPLLFALPSTPDPRRLDRLPECRGYDCGNCLLWMSDFSEHLFGFPEQADPKLNYSGREETIKVEKVGRFAIPVASQTDGQRIHIPLTVFQATVGQGAPVTVLFSPAESKTLLQCVLLPFAVPIKIVAIVNQSSFGPRRHGFDHYKDLPQIFSATNGQMVEAYLIDNRYVDLTVPGYYRTGFACHWGQGGTDLWRKSDGNLKRRALAALE